MTRLDWDDMDTGDFRPFHADSHRQTSIEMRTTAASTVTTRRRRKYAQNSRASTPANGLLLSLLLILLSCRSFGEASTLPFGRIPMTSRKQQQQQTNARAPTDLAGRVFQTRAGASSTPTTASFIGTAASGGSVGLESLSYYLRVALAGGVAGATGSAVLYPIDSAKTLRQSDPSAYSSVKDALFQMLRSKHSIQRVYKGILPAALGAIPSSALYFGAYESSKVALKKLIGEDVSSKSGDQDYRRRLAIHGLAAACGNVISSFVFVPKEVIKQQLQMRAAAEGAAAKATIGSIVRQKGISGLYAGYGATLLRNIPSATIRFVLYEELKRKWATTQSPSSSERREKLRAAGTFLAGAVAGSTSSFVMTPIDVVKTRMATGSCPLGVKNCMVHVIQEVGWKGLYAGAGSRVLWSGAFSAIGFGTFEMVKGYLGVGNASSSLSTTTPPKTPKASNPATGGARITSTMPTKTLAKTTIRTR